VEACRLHRQDGSQHKDDLNQGSGRENLVQQRHVMLRCRRIIYREARYNRSLDAIPMNDIRQAASKNSVTQKTKKARWPFGHRAGLELEICWLPTVRFKRSDHPRAGEKRIEFVLKCHEPQLGFRLGLEHMMDFRQYRVFGQPQGYCGWYSR
jgi:hypothetical protein